jgi:hypothetical protein
MWTLGGDGVLATKAGYHSMSFFQGLCSFMVRALISYVSTEAILGCRLKCNWDFCLFGVHNLL